MKYHFKVHKQEGGFWAECLELEGLVTEGKDRAELESNMVEALNLYLDEPEDSKQIFPLPNPFAKGRGVVEVKASPRVAMAMQIRQSRISAGLTQEETARKLGMTSLFSYQRMEKARHANVQLETLVKLKQVFPAFSVDAVLA